VAISASQAGHALDAMLVLSVYLPPIAQIQDSNQNVLVPNLANQTRVADSVFPEFAQLAAFERITSAARVIQHRDSIAQKRPDALGYRPIKFGKLFLGRFR
jgi:hypothetical protein